MKILYIFNFSGYGGASKSFLTMVETISLNNEIVCVFPKPVGSFSKKMETYQNTSVYYLNYEMDIYACITDALSVLKFPIIIFKRIFKNYYAYCKLLKIIEEEQPDIIHTNVGPVYIGYKAAKKLKIPHIWHLREYQDLDFGMHPIPSKKKFFQYLYDKNNHIVAITKGIFEYFKLGENAKIIYNGICNINLQREEGTTKEKYFLFAGRIEQPKGTLKLIKAFSEFAKNNIDYKLFIAGSGQGKYYKQCVDFVVVNGLTNRVCFLDFRTDIYELMQRATAIVVPSRFEGFGRITAEAMINNCLVVGKNTAGTKEQFDNGKKIWGKEIGIRFDSFDELPAIFTQIVEQGIGPYHEMINNAFNTVIQLYNNEKNAEKIIELYNQINQINKGV